MVMIPSFLSKKLYKLYEVVIDLRGDSDGDYTTRFNFTELLLDREAIPACLILY